MKIIKINIKVILRNKEIKLIKILKVKNTDKKVNLKIILKGIIHITDASYIPDNSYFLFF